MSDVEVAGVYEYAVKFVLPRFEPVSRLVEEFVKVDFEGKFEAIIDLRGGLESRRQLVGDVSNAYLNHAFEFFVILPALQLQV